MALPPLTAEQRSAALQRATEARRERAAVKSRLKNSGDSIEQIIAAGKENDAIGTLDSDDLATDRSSPPSSSATATSL